MPRTPLVRRRRGAAGPEYAITLFLVALTVAAAAFAYGGQLRNLLGAARTQHIGPAAEIAVAGPLFVRLSGAEIPEDAGHAELTAVLNRPGAFPARVVYQTADGSAQAGRDYLPANARATFQPGDTHITIRIPILNDADPETTEVFAVDLRAGEAWLTGPPEPARVAIADDDAGSPPAGNAPVVTLAGTSLSVPEGETADVTVRLAPAARGPVQIAYRTLPDTADASDFTPVSGTLQIATGQKRVTLPIETTDDSRCEGPEHIRVEIFDAVGARIANRWHHLLIVDDDDGTGCRSGGPGKGPGHPGKGRGRP